MVFRQVDNLICTGLSHSADLRTVSKSALSDEETLQSLAFGLGPTEALIIGNLTGGFPLARQHRSAAEGVPGDRATRSFWDGEDSSEEDEEPPQAIAA